jgi:hypothetical protein
MDHMVQVTIKKHKLECTMFHQVIMNAQVSHLMMAKKEFKSNASAQANPHTMAATEVVSSDGEKTKMAAVANKEKGKGKSRKEKKAVAKAMEQAAVSAPKADKKKKFDFSKPSWMINHAMPVTAPATGTAWFNTRSR